MPILEDIFNVFILDISFKNVLFKIKTHFPGAI